MVFDVMRMIMQLVMTTLNSGVARIFKRGGHRQGHHPGIADYIWFIPLLSLVYQRAQSSRHEAC